MEDYKEKYEQAMLRMNKWVEGSEIIDPKEVAEFVFPELKESEDEKIRKWLIKDINRRLSCWTSTEVKREEVLAWLEKQGEQKNEEMPALVCPKCMKSFEKCEDYSIYHNRIRYICPHCEYDGDSVEFETSYKNHPIYSVTPSMIQWKGNNLKQVIEFTGKSPKFNEWFKNFKEYETYVREHNNIFKLFNEDGSHYEVPVGAWIVKTPDGYNVPSKAKYKQKIEQKPAWSEEDERMLGKTISTIRYALSIPLDSEDDSCFAGSSTISWLKSLKEKMKGE